MRVDETAGAANGATDATGPAGGDGKRRFFARRDESGLVFVWTTLFLLVLLGFAALAVDLGHSYFVGEREQNAVDAAALAGAPYLPENPTAAHAAALELAAANGFTDGQDGVKVTAFPSPDNPAELQVHILQNVPTWFGGAIGYHTMTVGKNGTGIASQASSTPIDIMLILDRTQSMTPEDLQHVKDASGELLKTLKPKFDSIALGVTGPSMTTKQCGGGAYGHGAEALPLDMAKLTWIAAPYPNAAPSTDYLNGDGTLNPNSQLVKTINCLDTSQVNTNLGDPVIAAQDYFNKWGRPGVKKGIILMTDGAANMPVPDSACQYASNDASIVKAADIELITIGFGLDDKSDSLNYCTDKGGTFGSAFATKLLANMASPVAGVPAVDNGCTPAENEDDDDFYCVSKEGGDLSKVFVIAAANLTSANPRLIK